jgi:hypothetical protein
VTKRIGWIGLLLVAMTAGCAAESDAEAPIGSDDDMEVIAKDPVSMPKPILTFLKSNQWGRHHLEWHTVRNWDRLGASDQAWAKRQGWARADLQEGQKGNGLEFLAMHRVMFRKLTTQFPESADLFHGWDAPPLDPKDALDPVPSGNPPEFDAAKKAAIDKLQNHLDAFKSDDDFGLFVETSLRPTAQDPNARATDKGAGLHNYLHNRFSGDSKTVDIGDPSVNLQNRRFWRLHGWIESRWSEFRRLKGLKETDPAYQAALAKGEHMLQNLAKGGPNTPVPEAPPESLRKFFAQNP